MFWAWMSSEGRLELLQLVNEWLPTGTLETFFKIMYLLYADFIRFEKLVLIYDHTRAHTAYIVE